MALQLAALLEDAASVEDWHQMHLSCMNNAFSTFTMSSGFSVLVTIAGRSYFFTSDQSGKLTVSIPGPGRQTMLALRQAQARVVLDYDAFKDYDSTAASWFDEMVLKRKIRFEGDTGHLEDFEKEMGGKVDSVKAKVEAGGPGKAKIDEAQARAEEAVNDLKARTKEALKIELNNTTEMATLALPESASDWLLTDTQPAGNFYGWLHFSSMGSFTGSMGQSNYSAANCFLDVTTFNARIAKRLNDYPVTMMWGAVSGIGMRWKAFASQDFLEKDETLKEMVFDWTWALRGVSYIVRGFAPEWTTLALFDKPTFDFIKTNTVVRSPDPFKLSKGKGGGVSFLDMDESENVPSSKQVAKDNQGLCAGRRVELCGLVASPEMNDLKGTLLEEVGDDKWSVRLDDEMGDKIIKVQNIKGFATVKEISTEDQVTKEFCVAATWSDWWPSDMQWDAHEQCHVLDVQIESLPARFDVAHGRAGQKQWKSRKPNWAIAGIGKNRIKVFCKDRGMLDRVVVEKLAEEVMTAVPQENVDAEVLRGVLRSARPDWTDKELTSVEKKLAKVKINTASELLASVTEKNSGLSERLKAVGEKTFSSETLKAFRKCAKSHAESELTSLPREGSV